MQLKISQYRMLVKDFPACFRFYRDVLELPVGSGGEGDVYADFRLAENQTLGLFKRDLMAGVLGTADKPAHVEMQDAILMTFEVENVDEAVKSLIEKGVSFVTQPTDRPEWGMRTAHLRDPDGNLVELFHSIPMPE